MRYIAVLDVPFDVKPEDVKAYVNDAYAGIEILDIDTVTNFINKTTEQLLQAAKDIVNG